MGLFINDLIFPITQLNNNVVTERLCSQDTTTVEQVGEKAKKNDDVFGELPPRIGCSLLRYKSSKHDT